MECYYWYVYMNQQSDLQNQELYYHMQRREET
jgi:hypothetical protein